MTAAENFHEEIKGKLAELDEARSAMDAALTGWHDADDETKDYNALSAKMYELGAAARWFLHAHSPRRNPSPSLDPNSPVDYTGTRSPSPTTGVI